MQPDRTNDDETVELIDNLLTREQSPAAAAARLLRLASLLGDALLGDERAAFAASMREHATALDERTRHPHTVN
jgi:hypothetical protein